MLPCIELPPPQLHSHPRARFSVPIAQASLAFLLASQNHAHASFLHGEALDSLANFLAGLVLIIVPVVSVAVFWLIHILPEKIAEKKHHPQAEAIQCLCLLSLVFGGLLWPLAWLWAYSKPVFHKLAYEGDQAPDNQISPRPIAEVETKLNSKIP